MGVLICKQIKNTNYPPNIAAKDVYEQWVDTNARIEGESFLHLSLVTSHSPLATRHYDSLSVKIRISIMGEIFS